MFYSTRVVTVGRVNRSRGFPVGSLAAFQSSENPFAAAIASIAVSVTDAKGPGAPCRSHLFRADNEIKKVNKQKLAAFPRGALSS